MVELCTNFLLYIFLLKNLQFFWEEVVIGDPGKHIMITWHGAGPSSLQLNNTDVLGGIQTIISCQPNYL